MLPDDQPAKIGFMVLDEKYGFGSNEPVNISIDADMSSQPVREAIKSLENFLDEDTGFVEPNITYYSSVNFVDITSKISGDPQEQESLESIRRLRSVLIPQAFAEIPEKDYRAYVGGATAEVVDSVKMTDDYFPLVLGIVLSPSLIHI